MSWFAAQLQLHHLHHLQTICWHSCVASLGLAAQPLAAAVPNVCDTAVQALTLALLLL